jgi:hypothetical protein
MVRVRVSSKLERTGTNLMGLDQKRLASALSAAGLNDKQVGAEVLWYLPDGFASAYEGLWISAFGSGAAPARTAESGRVSVVKDQPPRTSSATVDRVGGVGAGHKKAGADTRDVLRSQRALSTKQWVDRNLRKLAREIGTRMNDESDSNAPRRCAGRCKRWADVEWSYCPNCGAPTETVDE